MEIMPRELELEETCNYVFVGLRRAGKSYLMFQHIQELLLKKEVRIEEILYINFEDGKSLYVVWLIPNIAFLLREVMHKC